ncbi:lanthionine synthetase LanC family protein [Streptomyces sp. NPDC050988]|uniref:lanthionine synthetase LanC family protein n=1 Tax=Streptomyces sp. NPDC050988 TaxID=3365637 RepID=UPI00379DDE59
MNALGILVLPPDVVLAPVAELEPEVRTRIGGTAGDFTVTRPGTRTVSSVVDRETAVLLDQFRTPRTIVDAVLSFCSANGADPRHTLDTAFGVIVSLVEERMLVPADSPAAQPVAGSLTVGAVVGGVTILKSIRVLNDTEVYRGRTLDGAHVALKLAGPAADCVVLAAMDNEAAVLDLLEGSGAPMLLKTGRWEGSPFLVTSWADGVDLHQAAEEARTAAEQDDCDGRLRLAGQVLEAYASLHARGVVHGDVHPRNAVVDGSGVTTVLDFGLASAPGVPALLLRGGIDLYQAPEIIASGPEGASRTSPALCEQYSLGALTFQIVTGGHTHAFSLLPDEMHRQLIEDAPLPFDQWGVRELPAVEACLSRALSKQPEARYHSVAEFHTAFLDAAKQNCTARRPSFSPRRSKKLNAVLDAVLLRLDPNGSRYAAGLEAPTASVTYGAAGIAYALLRIARVRGDEALLAHADLWVNRAEAALGTDEAFWNRPAGITPGDFGGASLYHHAAGVHCVSALVAHARGDSGTRDEAVRAFVAAGEGSRYSDLAFGDSGLLVGCSLLLETLGADTTTEAVRSLGMRLADRIRPALRSTALNGSGEPPLLGAAHGLAGLAFSALQWCAAAGSEPPSELSVLLDQLAETAEPAGRGMWWPRKAGDGLPESALVGSWCNGAAGFVHLWTSADRRWDSGRYESLAHQAAWGAYEGVRVAPGDLCCGLAGRAYALLAQYRHTGDRPWLSRARVLVEQAAAATEAQSLYPNSLYHGDVGVALIASELEHPEIATMPLVEAEGWTQNH